MGWAAFAVFTVQGVVPSLSDGQDIIARVDPLSRNNGVDGVGVELQWLIAADQPWFLWAGLDEADVGGIISVDQANSLDVSGPPGRPGKPPIHQRVSTKNC